MKILFIHPVVKEKCLTMETDYLKDLVNPETEIEVLGLEKGPRSIETFFDEVYAGPEILKTIERSRNVNAIVINCFADPALHAARDLADVLVLGAGETSMTIASLLGEKFGVISVMRNAGPQIEMAARRMGIGERLAYASGIDVSVLNLYGENKVAGAIVSAAEKAIEKGAEVIVLGCTGMYRLAEEIRKTLAVPVIEPASLTLKMAESLARLNLRHGKTGLYMLPDPKKLLMD